MPDYKGITAELEFAIENGCDYELIEQALIAITDLRNELCDKCGRYEYADYINQICDYTENAEHDDAPDSAASIVRLLWKQKTNTYKPIYM